MKVARLYDQQGRLFRVAITNAGWHPTTKEPMGKVALAAWEGEFSGMIEPSDLERFAREVMMLLSANGLTKAQLGEIYPH